MNLRGFFTVKAVSKNKDVKTAWFNSYDIYIKITMEIGRFNLANIFLVENT